MSSEDINSDLNARIDIIEEAYEFFLAYASQGLPSDSGSETGRQAREHLQRCDTALSGLAGVGLVGLVIAHVYFAVRPDKWWITKSMILGWITRRQYLEHHEPSRWPVGTARPNAKPAGQS